MWLGLVATAWTVAVEWLRFHDQVDLGVALASHLALLGTAILIGRGKQLRAAWFFFTIAVGVVAFELAAQRLVIPTPDYHAGAMRLMALLAGFVAFSLVTLTAKALPEQAPDPPMPVSRPALGLAVFGVSLGVLVLIRGLTHHTIPVGLDEVIDVLQSRWMWQPGFGPAYDQETLQHLHLGFTFVHDGRLYGQFAPGWPAVIALASAVGLFSYVSAILGALSVLLCFLIAEALLDWRSGLACALLLLTQPWFVVWHEGFMPHPLTITLSLLSAWLLIRVQRLPTRRNLLLLLAGLSAGCATAARPLTGACLFASLALWCWLADATRPGRRILDTLYLGAGATVPVFLTLLYNARATGNPLVFGYSYLHGSLNSLGFGIRGFIGRPHPFTPVDALHAFAIRLNDFLQYAIGFALLLPTLAMALASGRRPKWRSLVPLLTLPVAYFFYFYSVNRFYLEVLPFAIIGWLVLVTGMGLSRLGSLALVLLACLGNVLVPGRRPFRLTEPSVSRAVDRLADRATRERLLVLVDTVGAPRRTLGLAFFGLAGVERDARPFVLYSSGDDSMFIRRFRDRTPLWVTLVQPDVPAIRETPAR
jgi:hypothetical protein